MRDMQQELERLKKSKEMQLKVGTRVKVFGKFSAAEGGSVFSLDGVLGTVISIEGVWVEVDLDEPLPEKFIKNPQRIDGVHYRQCEEVA